MSDNNFRLIDPDEAVAWGCLLIFLAALAFAVDEPEPQQVVAQGPTPCPHQWIAQSGLSEKAVPVCVVADLTQWRELPPHILTMPVTK